MKGIQLLESHSVKPANCPNTQQLGKLVIQVIFTDAQDLVLYESHCTISMVIQSVKCFQEGQT